MVTFKPSEKKLIHIEASGVASSWNEREFKFRRKFEIGRKYIPSLFEGFELPEIESLALIVEAAPSHNDEPIGGGKVRTMDALLEEIKKQIPTRTENIIHEQFVILRTLQFAKDYWL